MRNFYFLNNTPQGSLIKCLLLTFLIIHVTLVDGQDTSSQNLKLFRPNVIKFNVTSNILYGPAAIFSYERAIRPNKTFSIEAGIVEFPSLDVTLPDKILSISEPRGAGIKTCFDFRFYLSEENKHPVPHGVYLAPYIAYYGFFNERDVLPADSSIGTGIVNLSTSIHTLQLGGALGYQFMLAKDRMAIDLVLAGPAFAYYTAKLNLDGNIDINEENAYLQDLLNVLIDSFPLFGELVGNHEISSSGVADLFYGGFRYSMSIGYRF